VLLKKSLIISCLLLTLCTFALYWPVRSFDFVNYDDPAYVTQNPHVQQGLSSQSATWAFTSAHASNWHPLTWISHMLDVTLFGVSAGAHHMVNVVLHTLNALLVLLVLFRMTGRVGPAFVVAALFAWHPLHVESVAWVAERKDVLSALFWLLTILCYAEYSRAQRGANKARLYYVAALGCFLLGLLSKPMVVTLPMVLLLLDVWPLKRVSLDAREGWRGILIEKVPFLLLSSAVSIVTFIVQRGSGAVASMEQVPLYSRLANVVVAYSAYLRKFVWASDLAVFYPHPGIWPVLTVLVSGVALVLLTVVAVVRIKRGPWLLVGWLWYLGVLVPVIGLVQVGNQAFADRYTYLSLIGVCIAVAYEISGWQYHRLGRSVTLAGGTVVLIACLWATARQLEHWRNTETLMRRALAVTRNNHVAHHNLGYYLSESGNREEAREHYQAALAIMPDYYEARMNLGLLLLKENLPTEAEPHFVIAAKLNPESVEAQFNLGLSLGLQGRHQEAAERYRRALAFAPNHVNALFNLGNSLFETGNLPEAEKHYRATLAAAREQGVGEAKLSVVHRQLGRVLQQLGPEPEVNRR
jgi:tetratricopeptide (TPR) repeat protein